MKGSLDASGEITNAENQRDIAFEMGMQAPSLAGCVS